MFKFVGRARESKVIVFVYSNGRKFEGPQGLTFEGQKRAIQIKCGISYNMLKKMISDKLKLQSHQIISSLTYRFPTSHSTYTDLEIFNSEGVKCMINAAKKHSQVNVLELYVEIDIITGSSSSIPAQSRLPSDANNIGLSNNDDEDRSSKDEDGSGVPNEESSGNSIAKSEDSCSPPPPSTSMIPASIPQPQPWKYHAFLSFRGLDIRRGFASHLHASLERKGVITYRDDRDLEEGEEITNILKAVEESMIAIVVLSDNYASSTWCLDEAQKIIECNHKLGQIVVPIFYHVEPSEVRNQIGIFQRDFARHEDKFGENSEKVLRWRDALKEVTNYRGWNTYRNQHEPFFVERITESIRELVIRKLPPCTMYLASRVEELITFIDDELKNINKMILCRAGYKIM